MVSFPASYYTSKIAAFYQQTTAELGASLTRLTTGKRYNTPADDPTGFIRARSFSMKADLYKGVREDFSLWEEGMNQAGEVADQVYNNVIRMTELYSLAGQSTATAGDRANYQTEFNTLAVQNQKMINNTTYLGKTLLSTVGTLTMDPDSAAPSTVAITLGQAIVTADATNLATVGTDDISDFSGAGGTAGAARLHANADLALATTSIQSFMSAVGTYKNITASNKNYADTIISNADSAGSILNNINEAEEMSTYTMLGVRQQTAAAMLAQANMNQRNVLSLYGFSSR
jgi:flagellin